MERMIFVLSPGRCGTAYLAKMLETVPGVKAEHEPDPNFMIAAKRALFDLDVARRFWEQVKLPAIQAVEEPVYFETSHLFVNFADVAPAGIDVVMLTRPHREVALSTWRRRAIPGRTPQGRTYQMHPDAPSNVRPLENWQRFNDYQLCYWHCLEVEARSKVLAHKFADAGSVVHHTTLDHITTEEWFNWMLTDLELPQADRGKYQGRRRSQVNRNQEKAYRLWPEVVLDEAEEEIERG